MGQIIDPNSLLIKTDQQPATVAFFNNLISQICFALNGVGMRMDGYDAAEQNLVNLGLANINSDAWAVPEHPAAGSSAGVSGGRG